MSLWGVDIAYLQANKLGSVEDFGGLEFQNLDLLRVLVVAAVFLGLLNKCCIFMYCMISVVFLSIVSWMDTQVTQFFIIIIKLLCQCFCSNDHILGGYFRVLVIKVFSAISRRAFPEVFQKYQLSQSLSLSMPSFTLGV